MLWKRSWNLQAIDSTILWSNNTRLVETLKSAVREYIPAFTTPELLVEGPTFILKEYYINPCTEKKEN